MWSLQTQGQGTGHCCSHNAEGKADPLAVATTSAFPPGQAAQPVASVQPGKDQTQCHMMFPFPLKQWYLLSSSSFPNIYWMLTMCQALF